MAHQVIEYESHIFNWQISIDMNQFCLSVTHFYKIIQIVRALWLAIKPFYMSVCKHGFHTESSRGVLPAIYLAVTQFL